MSTNPKLMAKAQKLYESGKTLQFIADKVGRTLKTIHTWKKNGDWKKGSITKKLLKKEEDSLLAMAAKVGLTKEKTFRKIAEFQEAKTQKVVGEEVIEFEDTKTQIEGNKQAIDVLGLKNQTIKVNDVTKYQSLVERFRDE